ncbi:MAG TPA: DNA polymerase III subunit gamma/tau [Candidatus Saccharimonadales bacterium]|nr:DNA polymerase III subunit gamma/tau [Candidatus Saccharimonadales bacterium]
MGQALYRKHRPKKLSEVIGQDHITKTLNSALKTGRISHAYLFTGPRGVGKTSVARILAYEVNGLPYDEQSTPLDIIEIDAASNRRIDEIRELREKVHNAPTSAKYKVYIIDEVHMLTREAFNALLKTLEEPPEHVIFILATTEAHKLPETIVSRTQRFNFKPIEDQTATKYLRQLADDEKIAISDDALKLVAEHGYGSFRDSISLLDQMSNSPGQLEVDTVRQMLGIAPMSAIKLLIDGLSDNDSALVINSLSQLLDYGSSPKQLARQLSDELRREMLDSSLALPNNKLTTLMRQLIEVPASHDPAAALQIALVEAALIPEMKSGSAVKSKQPSESPAKTIDELKPADQIIIDEPAANLENLEPTELWPKVLQEVKKHHNTLYSIARMAQTTTGPDSLILEFEFAFHQKRLNEPKNKQIIAGIIRRITGRDYKIDFMVNQTDGSINQPKVKSSDSITTISNIFGDAEVLES